MPRMMSPDFLQGTAAGRQRGLSLLEALIAVLLISLALLGLVSLQARTVQLSTEAEDVQRASLLAGELSTAMLTANTLTLPADTLLNWESRVASPASGGLPGAVGAVTVASGVARVRIEWAPPRAAGASSVYLTDIVLPQ